MVGRIFGIGHDDQMSSSPVRPPRLTPSDYLGRIDRATEQFADLIATGDLTAALPTCPGWTFTDLIAHLGEIHQWAAHAIVAGNPDAETIPEPSEPAALVDAATRADDLGLEPFTPTSAICPPQLVAATTVFRTLCEGKGVAQVVGDGFWLIVGT